MKRVFCILAISCSPLMAFEGFYVGGGIGGHIAEGAQTGNALGTQRFIADVGSYSVGLQNNMFDHDITGIFYAGYGVNWRSFGLSAEGFVQLGSANLSSEQFNKSTQGAAVFQSLCTTDVHMRCCQFGLDVLPGWSANHTTCLYGRIGVSCVQSTLNTNAVNRGLTGTLNLDLSMTKTRAAFRAGGGIEQRLTPSFSLRTDYIYTDYGTLTLASSLAQDTLFLQSNAKVHLYDHALMLGLSYHFCKNPSLPYVDFCSDACTYRGFYVAAALGGGDLEVKEQGSIFSVAPTLDNISQSALAPFQDYNNQFQGGFFLGYGRSWYRLYLGGEVFASAATHTQLNGAGRALYSNVAADIYSMTSYDTSIESSTWQYGFDLRPGALLTPMTLLYGRIGVSAAQITATSNGLFIENFTGNPTALLPESVSASTWKPTFRLGVGLEQLLTSKFHLRADYIFTNYGAISFNNTATGLDSLGNTILLNNTISSHLQNNAIVIGLSYYFH